MGISKIDKIYYNVIRESVSNFIKKAAISFDKKNNLILDVAPQVHLGAKEHFKNATIKTLDLDFESGADFIADLCQDNSKMIPSNYFDLIICTEVLEHVDNPFDAVKELIRMTKPNGYIYVTTPFNFRIHNPLPDNWRFTEHGLRRLFKDVSFAEIEENTSDRFLMPIQYKGIFQK